jgi:hypothetical protein
MELKRGIDQAVQAAVQAIDELAKPVEGTDIAHVGTISANSGSWRRAPTSTTSRNTSTAAATANSSKC